MSTPQLLHSTSEAARSGEIMPREISSNGKYSGGLAGQSADHLPEYSDHVAEPARSGEPAPRLMRLSDALAEMRADADAARLARVTGMPRGAISGLSTLDRELAGAFAPGLHFLHGNAGSGKTALALQIAGDCQCPALFVSCEMSPAELLRRHTARKTGTFLERFKSGEMSGADIESLARHAIEAAPDLAFLDVTRASSPPATKGAPALSAPEYLRQCALIVKGEAQHLLIVIDSLHTWTQTITGETGASEYEALNISIRTLQILAARLECAILIISERNRASMNGGGLNAGAGTRKIEYQGESVLDLDRKAAKPKRRPASPAKSKLL
jgi:replicative DNA helicase